MHLTPPPSFGMLAGMKRSAFVLFVLALAACAGNSRTGLNVTETGDCDAGPADAGRTCDAACAEACYLQCFEPDGGHGSGGERCYLCCIGLADQCPVLGETCSCPSGVMSACGCSWQQTSPAPSALTCTVTPNNSAGQCADGVP